MLINETRSIFKIADVVREQSTYVRPASPLRRRLSRLVPSLTLNLAAPRNYRRLAQLLAQRAGRQRVLVVGGRVLGYGMDALERAENVALLSTDIALGPRTDLICDAHDLPFPEGTFDAVIVQAVLEAVVDPYRCVDEIYRVLKPDGLVYAETPFMQQVHAGAYDFIRFTHLGHRRLFRRFEEVDSGVACGPATALAWSLHYLVLSAFESAFFRRIASVAARFLLFWVKYLDYPLASRRGSLDAASGLYFLGRKSDVVLADEELIGQYRGLV